MKINFYPDHDDLELIKSAEEYQEIWIKESARIIETIERLTGLKFTENTINAVVIEGVSRSHPLSLRASYPIETKKATLVHELFHRLIPGKEDEIHKLLDLILYDVWIDLWGEDFAKKQVKVESERQPLYKDAWDWALSLTREQRAAKFKELIGSK